ncbi:hypothetical protein DFH09DRAFT_128729 [Mycena vulgaris]|nr:hypothetical protein DFH09DRAFT_128729 [Mycena vulgaris]
MRGGWRRTDGRHTRCLICAPRTCFLCTCVLVMVMVLSFFFIFWVLSYFIWLLSSLWLIMLLAPTYIYRLLLNYVTYLLY